MVTILYIITPELIHLKTGSFVSLTTFNQFCTPSPSPETPAVPYSQAGGLALPLSAPRAQGAGDLHKVTLEHGQRAEGQVLALLEGLLQLAQSGDPLWGARQWIQVPNVTKPVHGSCRKGSCPDTESGTWHPTAHWPWPRAQ